MSEIKVLKQKINKKLDCISKRSQLRLIDKMMDRLEELEKYFGDEERPMTRGCSTGNKYYKKEVRVDLNDLDKEGDTPKP